MDLDTLAVKVTLETVRVAVEAYQVTWAQQVLQALLVILAATALKERSETQERPVVLVHLELPDVQESQGSPAGRERRAAPTTPMASVERKESAAGPGLAEPPEPQDSLEETEILDIPDRLDPLVMLATEW